jgi:DNA-binding NarL/FixJ family response regulator
VIRVFIVAASTLVRAGLQNVLAHSRFNIAGSAANLESLSEQLADLETDVVLIETSADGHEGLLDALAVGDIMSDYATIVLADQVSPGWTAEALRAGIRAVLPSDVSPEQLRAALEATAAGLVVMHPREASAAFPAPAATAAPLSELPEPLTRRESEVLQMLAGGLANKEIAARLSISDHTVKFHVASILGKLGASTRTEAVSIGIRQGLVLL